MIGELLDRRCRDDGVVAGSQHQDRLANLRGIVGGAEAAHRLKRCVSPRHRRCADAERRVFFEYSGIAGVTHGIAGQRIADERRRSGQFAAAAGNVAAALPGEPQHPQQRARKK